MSMPAALADVVSDFADVQGQDKLQLLLEFANELPPLPADLEEVVALWLKGGRIRVDLADVFDGGRLEQPIVVGVKLLGTAGRICNVQSRRNL